MAGSKSTGNEIVKRIWIVLACSLFIGSGAGAQTATHVPEQIVSPDPSVLPITGASLRQAIKANHGKVVLVNFWATYCPTCVDEFPALMQTSQKFKQKGLVVLAVSADSPDDVDAKVKPFLQRNHIASKTYILTEDPDSFVPNFDKNWIGGGLPRTYIFDRKGKFRFVTSAGQTEQGFVHLIKPYL